MIDLLGNAINHIPGRMIRDRTRIGNDNDSFQYVLVFEDGEFRVYMYEFLDEAFDREHYDIGFREAGDYFDNFQGYLNIDTLSYTRLDLDEGVAKAISDLYSYVRKYLPEEETPRDVDERIVIFIKKYIEKLGAKVYQYYK